MGHRNQNVFLGVIAGVAWFALIAQFYLNMQSGVASVPELVVRYVSYFTILTNFLVAMYCSVRLLKPESAAENFLARQSVATAIAVYITVVGLIYNVILRSLWNPQGLQKIVDELLHTIIPVLFVIFWVSGTAKNNLAWKHILTWLLYPLLYLIFILIRGKFFDFYPYPFLDVSKLGFTAVLINSVGVTLVFLFFSFLFVGIGKLFSSKSF